MKKRKNRLDRFLKRQTYVGKTAMQLNREEGGGGPFYMLPVPLMSEKQLYYLRVLADRGIIGQTPEEVASWFIGEGIRSYMGNKVAESARLYPPDSWKGFEA